MLHYETIHPTTLELLKKLTAQEELRDMRLVGGTSLALQYGHRQSVDLDFFGKRTKKDFVDIDELLKHYDLSDILGFYSEKYPNYSIFRALLSLTYFEDAETQAMPVMFSSVTWDEIKKNILEVVKNQNNTHSLS